MKVSFLKKSAVLAASIMAMGFAVDAVAAPANPVFTLSPGNILSTLLPTSFMADTLSGTSTELLTATASGESGSGYLLYTAATLNGSPQYPGFYTAGSPFASSQYNLYVLYQLTDNGNGSVGAQNTVTSLNFQFYIDPTHDDTFTPATAGLNTSTPAIVTGTGNDIFLAYGTLISGVDGFNAQGGAFLNATETFNICSGVGTAKFGSATVAATAATPGTNGSTCTGNSGTQFFTAPVPFYNLAFAGFNNDGNPTNVQRGSGTTGNQIAINSAVGNVSFNRIPEPSTVALFGIAAAGLALSSRRSRRK